MNKKNTNRVTRSRGAELIAAFDLRWSILEEDHLRRKIADDEGVQRTRPDLWRRLEAERRAENTVIAATNERLRAAGLAPVRLRPTLARRRQNLQRLERRNAAEIANFQAQKANDRAVKIGTPFARRGTRRGDD